MRIHPESKLVRFSTHAIYNNFYKVDNELNIPSEIIYLVERGYVYEDIFGFKRSSTNIFISKKDKELIKSNSLRFLIFKGEVFLVLPKYLNDTDIQYLIKKYLKQAFVLLVNYIHSDFFWRMNSLNELKLSKEFIQDKIAYNSKHEDYMKLDKKLISGFLLV